MAKLFVYKVDGKVFQGHDAWGQAWDDAKAVAKDRHCPIFRSVVKGDKVDHQFFAKGGAFLSLRSYSPDKLYLF